MRLARHRTNGLEKFAIVEDDHLVDLDGIETLGDFASIWMSDGSDALPATGSATDLESAHLLAPIGPPLRNLMCVGWNYRNHFDEGRRTFEAPTEPMFFTKATTTVNDPFGAIPTHEELTAKLDWEVELAVVIGARGCDIDEESALSHVLGYTIANDVSARDLQLDADGQWFKGKSLDGTCPLGPWIVTTDDLPDPHDCVISSRVNGRVKQESHTGLMAFTVGHIIASLSRGLTLLPGDVILTGTPEGVGLHRDPPEFLREGDVVEASISGIGALRNQVGRASPTERGAPTVDTTEEKI